MSNKKWYNSDYLWETLIILFLVSGCVSCYKIEKDAEVELEKAKFCNHK